MNISFGLALLLATGALWPLLNLISLGLAWLGLGLDLGNVAGLQVRMIPHISHDLSSVASGSSSVALGGRAGT